MTGPLPNKRSTESSDPPINPDTGILDGAFIGIVIGGVTIAIAFGLCVYFCVKKRKNQSAISTALDKSVSPDNSLISSKAVPLVSILAGQAPLPSNHEFERLTKYEDGFTERFTISQGKRYNKTGFFNLIPENLPFDHNRVTLKSPINGCDYVNATWLANASEEA